MKKITVASLAIILVGCGGGGGTSGGSDDVASTAKINQSFYTFDYEAQEGQAAFDFNSIKTDVKDNIGFDPEGSAAFESDYVLTDKQLYEPNFAYQATLKTNSLTNWTMQVLPDVNATFDFERVELKGKSIYDTVLPGYRDYLTSLLGITNSVGSQTYATYLKANTLLSNPATFSDEAFCLRTKSFQFNKNFLTFDTSHSLTVVDSNNTYDQVITYLKDTSQHTFFTATVTSDVLNGYRWSTIDTVTKDDGQSGRDYLIEYQTKPYFADRIDNQKYLQANQVERLKLKLAEADGILATADLKRELAEAQFGCSYYNEVAANQIANFIK